MRGTLRGTWIVCVLAVGLAGCAATPRSSDPGDPVDPGAAGPAVSRRGADPEPLRAAVAHGPGSPLAVIDAIGIALRNNPDLEAAAWRIDQADAGLAEARSVFWPVLSADFGYLAGEAPSAFLFKTIDARRLRPGTDFNDPGRFDNFELGGTVSWNLFRGGARIHETRVAQAQRALGVHDRARLENRLISSVIQGYYDVLAAAEFTATAEASVRTVEAQLDEVRKLFAGGATGTRKADVLALEVRLAEARERELRARNARSLAAAALANLMGLAPDSELALSGDEWRPRELPDSYEAAVAEAMARRPEMASARTAVERADRAKRAEKAAFLPRVDLVGRGWWDDPDLKYEAGHVNWTIGAMLSWEIFRGGATSGRVRRAKAAVEEMRALDRKAALDVELDVRSAYLRLEEARARLDVAEQSVAQAEESLDLVRKLYDGGAATITRYLEAELALTAARMRATQGRFDVKKASADLGRSMGWCGECAREEGKR
ncbi:MAG: TolC family protein [Planctomycetes bacterium]|nr:TolC family protein [Planctomycetota bacterium]